MRAVFVLLWLTLVALGGTCEGVPAVPTAVYLPAGTCRSDTMIEVETLQWVRYCPDSQCWVHVLTVPFGTCIRFNDQWEVEGVRVRCATATEKGVWVEGLNHLQAATLTDCVGPVLNAG